MILVIGACLWALLFWFQFVHYLPMKRAIVGCTHTRGKLVSGVSDRRGRPTALIWMCDSCPLQIPLKLHRVKDRVWIEENP